MASCTRLKENSCCTHGKLGEMQNILHNKQKEPTLQNVSYVNMVLYVNNTDVRLYRDS